MTHRSILLVIASIITLTGVVTSAVKPIPVADVTRQIYISATDRSGAPVTDLTATDISIKEGGKDRPVESLKPATGPMHVAVLVDDGGSGAFQAAVAQFLDRTLARGQFSITLLNPQASMLVDFTNDPSALRDAVNRLGKRGRLRPAGFEPDGDQILDAIERAAKALQQRKAERAVVIALTLVGGKPELIDPNNVLDHVRASGTILNVVYLAGADLGMVMGDGPRHSGGRLEEAGNGNGIIPAAIRVAESLQTQYVVTYTIPDGTSLSDRIAVSTSRKGIKLTAPTRIAAKLPAPVR
jgi:VWFA-related protein